MPQAAPAKAELAQRPQQVLPAAWLLPGQQLPQAALQEPAGPPRPALLQEAAVQLPARPAAQGAS